MTTTKKVLFVLFALCWMPAMMFAQSSVDSVTVFRENFDGGSPMFTTSYLYNANGDWRLDSSLSVTSPACMHASLYAQAGNMTLTTAAIPLSSPSMTDRVRRVYLFFDHICKVNELDNATIFYRTATGMNDDGTYMWSSYRLLNFDKSSSFYYGDGQADPYGTRTTAHFGNYTSGMFNHKCYGEGNTGLWKPNNNNAAPTNAWWRHEILDITHFVLDSTVTHIQIQFRVNKQSPSSSGTEVCAGWFVDNFTILLSNCELEIPRIKLSGTVYAGGDANCGALNTNLRNNTGPYNIEATIQENDTLNLNTLLFTYQKNSEPVVTLPNDNIISNTLTASGHMVKSTWQLPDICYYDTIRYHIYIEDVHGNRRRLDTFLIAWHNQTNIQNNDCRADSINVGEFPHCFITGIAQPIKFYFTNKSDALHSAGNPYQTTLSVVLKVEDENHQVTHNSTHNWTGAICMDVGDTLSLGSFTPTRGYNYITAYITTRNGQTDGNHTNDTIRYTGFACDSLLKGHYTVGGTNPDFADMEAVKTALYFCGVDGPTTFHFRPGTYQDFDFTQNYVGQSETNTITFQGDSRDNVIITNNHTDNGNNTYGAVTLLHVDNFLFKDLTINGNNTSTSKGVLFRGNGSHNITFDNCKITANNTNTTDATCFAVGRTAAAAGTQGQTVTPDLQISITNCILQGGNFGIYYIGSSAQRNVVSFANNNIQSCYKGIHTNYCNSTVQGNHITQSNMGSHQNFTGIYVEQSIGPDINGNTIENVYDAEYGILLKNASGNDFYVRNNHVKIGNSNFGIQVANSSSTSTAIGYMYNNEVILYPVVADNSYAVQILSSNGLKVFNNSFYIKSDAPYSNTAALMIQNNNNTYLNNNILLNYCNYTSGSTNYPLYLNGSSTVTGAENDLASSSGVIVFKTSNMNSIAEMENNISTMRNNISMLPPMADPTQSLLPTDFNGLECHRNDTVLTDIRNIQRTNPTYMGAYANAIPAVDAAVTAMLDPTLGECPANSYNITLNIANKGSQALNFANNSATVTVHSDSLNLTHTTNINSGSVAIMSSISHVAASNITIPTNQPIDLTFVIHTNGDLNTSNDTLKMNFILEVAKPDYDETFTNGTQQTWTMRQISTGSAIGNWVVQDGSGVYPDIAPVYGTGRLFFNSKNFAANTISQAIMPVIDMNESVNPILEMWFAHDRVGNANLNEGVTVKVSTDGGETFTPITAIGQSTPMIKRFKNTVTEPTWELYTYDLSSYSNTGCIYIAFEATGQHNSNLNIDRVRLRNLVDNDIAISQIYARGESPNTYDMDNVVKALARNEGRQDQTNIKVYLTVTGAAEQYQDSLVIPSLASGAETIISFPDHHYNVREMKNVEVRSRIDQVNGNNAINWPMEITANSVNYADTSDRELLIGDYNNIIRPCVRYTTDEELAVTAVKYFYDMSYIADPENGFRAFVSNANGQIIATSNVINFSDLVQGDWNIIPINNFALTNMNDELYVGIEMLAKGDYLCAQIESPLRDSAFFYLENNGTYTPQTTGRFMIGAIVDTPFVHDLAILSLDNPTSRCDLGHEHLTVTVTNNGSEDLLPGTMMHYTVNGLPVVNEAMTDTLHSHETSTFTFSTPFDFTNNLIEIDSNYNIRVWATKDAQDRLQYNDTLAETIVSRGKSNTPIVPDTVNINYYTSGILTAHLPNTIDTGVIGWFASTGYESWENLGFSDSTYQTPVIFFDTTFYANANPGFIFDTVVGSLTGQIGNGSQPFTFSKGYSRGRILYTENEIGQHGPIASIGIYVNANTNVGPDGIPIKIYLKETSLSIFPTTAVFDWENEILGATLVVDEMVHFDHTGWHFFTFNNPFNYNTGNLIVLTETNCADFCTGTGNQCTNCGTYVSGGTGYPTFRQTNCSNGYVQYKDNNTLPMTGNYSNYTKRLTMWFNIKNLECGSQKVPIRIHVPDIPTYDVQTLSLDYPTTNCALYDEHIQVSVKNMLNIAIPAGKVTVHAVFNNGTELTETVNEEFAPEETKVVTFSETYDFSAPHANTVFNYVIYTTMNNEAIVYSGNDTITGALTSNYTAGLEESYTYQGDYTQSMQILQPDDRNRLVNDVQFYYFYDSTQTLIHTTTANVPYYQTPALYDSVLYWVRAKTKTNTCTTRFVPIHINVPVPPYDLRTDALIDPVSYQCGVSESYPIQVQVTNTDTTASSVIPAGTFNITAQFTGTHNANSTILINQPISSLENFLVTFANGVDIGSQTQNRIYNYTIFTNSTNDSYVYRLNDTIRGTLHVPANPTTVPSTITFNNTNYGQPYTVNSANFGNNPYTYYYFYNSEGDNIPFAQGQGFTTDPLYQTVQYYYSGRIENPEFENLVTVGTGNTGQTVPFTFTAASSYGRIHYSSDELGGHAGRIDTIFIRVKNANANAGTAVPIKIWMANTNDTTYTTNTPPAINWNNVTSAAKLVFDGDLAFENTDWYAIPIQGGFDYDGRAIYMYTEHDCGTGGCLSNYGISPPQFYCSNIQKRVMTKTTGNFGWSSYRWNTRFKFSYTCESPKGLLQINTQQRAHDLHVETITAPTTPNNNYTTNETVTVRITNHGTSSESNFPVKYQLNNGTPVTQNYSGTLASGASATMTFSTRVDLSDVYFSTPFKVYVDLSNDNYRNNDTATIHLRKPDPSPASSPTSTSAGLHITNVTFAGINNGNPSPFKLHPRVGDETYSDFTLDPTKRGTVVKGHRYPLYVYHSFETNNSIRAYKAVYIDFNRDNAFTTNERVSIQNFSNTNVDSLMFLYVKIPSDAETGLTRMRVITSSTTIPSTGTNQGTGFYTQGETEDYAINILPPYENDMGITSYLHPVGDVCPDDSATMRVWVKNYGSEPQTFTAGTPLTVTSTVRQGASTNTYNAQLTSGTVAPGDSTIVLLKPVNLGAIGSYVIFSRLTYGADQYAHDDTLTTKASTDSLHRVLSVPYFEDFDHNTGNTISTIHFTDDWILDSKTLNYMWTIHQGASDNSPQAGPNTDHTQGNPTGRYATIPGPGIATQYANLTSRCINLHYNHGYPVELSFYKHFFGNNAADFNMEIQVGSGQNFVNINTLHKADGGQNSSASLWSQDRCAIIGIDEVAQLRFKVSNHSGLVDPSIDDIDLQIGVPVIRLESILYPVADMCVEIGETIRPQVVIRNDGLSPINKFDLMTSMSVSDDVEYRYDTIVHTLMPGESMTYTLNSGFTVEYPSSNIDFMFKIHTDYDPELEPECWERLRKHVLTCSNWSVTDIDNQNGIVLMQNEPNPANVNTRIAYSLPESGNAKLCIYSALGQLLYSDTQDALEGINSFDVNTSSFADGIYFYTLKFKDVVLTKKMVIQK